MAESPRTILILASNPVDTERLRLDAELRAIDEGLKRATHRDQFTLVSKHAVRPEDVQRALLDCSPQIVHFSGHGAGSAGVYLENEQGKATLVTGKALSELFALFEDVACVVLNACYSEEQATAIAHYVPYVVGMSDQISDDAAMRFAVAFYDALGAGRSYQFAFRLGCNAINLAGLAEELIPILFAKDKLDSTEQALFLSFAPDDQAWVEGFLLDALDTVGIQTTLQPLPPSIQTESDIFSTAFPKAAEVLLVLSPSYPLMEAVPYLIRRFGSEPAKWPVRLLMLKATQLPPVAATLPMLAATDAAQWSAVVDKLARDLARNPVQAAAHLVCPYPGMRAFDELNSHHFYGRNAEIELLRSHLRLNPFIAVIGPSGSGKSSLVLAGLLPTLRQPSNFFGPGQWIIKEMRPGTEPLTTLGQTLQGWVDGSTWRPLERAGVAALDRVLLVVDQFEETFTFADPAQVRPFQDALLALINAPKFYVVITVRADFYVDLMNSPLWSQVSKRRLEVLPLKADGLREAIVNPATNSGVYIEEALVAQLLDDANEEPGVLPFVQETMVLLWEKLERRFLPATAYKKLSDGTQSGLSGLYLAMTQRANSTLNSLSPQQEMIARRILLRLIQFGEGRADTRRQQSVTSLIMHQEDQTLFAQTLRKLTDERLLTLNAEEARSAETGEPKVDIAHESLLNGWPQLRTWINQRRAAEQTRRRLEDKAAEWVRLGKGEGGLLDDVALAEAEAWLQSPDAQELGFSPALADLVAASRKTLDAIADKERRARRLRLALVGTVALLIIGLLAGGIWVQRQTAIQQQALAEKERLAAEEANQLRLDAEDARNAAQQSADDARQAQDLAEERLQESERQSNINRAQTIRVQSQLALARNAECSLALALEAYDSAVTIPNFASYPFQDSVRDALQATRIEQVLPANSSLFAVAWSNDGRTIGAGGLSGGTQLWEATEDGFQEAMLISNPNFVSALSFSPDDSLLAIGSSEIVLWNRSKDEAAGTLRGHTQAVRVLAWHPNGRWLASGSDDGTVILWDTQAQKSLQVLAEHQMSDGVDDIYGLAWNPDGTWLASAGADNNIRLWDASGMANDASDKNALILKATWRINDQGQPDRLAWSPDGSRLAASYAAGTIQVWNMDSEVGFTDDQPPKQLIEAHTGSVVGLAWSPDGSRLASSAEDQTVRIWAGQPLKLLATLSGHTDSVAGGVAWKADGTALVSASRDQSVRVWRLTPGGVTSQPIDGFLLDANWQPDPKQRMTALAIATEDGHLVRLWNVENNTSRNITTTHASTILRGVWSPDGKQLATASADTQVHVYDAQSGERLHQLTGHTGPVYDVAWSPDGRQLASAAYDGSVRLWKLNDETSERFFGSDFLNSISWHPDATYFVAGASNGLLNVWDVATGQRYDWKGHEAAVSSVVWHPDGQWLASAGQNGRIIIWDTVADDWTTGHIWKDQFDLGEQIWDLAWHGNLLAASGANDSVKVWDVVTGETIANYGGHQGAVRAVDWSPDGRYLITAGMTDGTALVHYANFSEDLLPIARRQLERGSTEADRTRCLADIQ